MEKKIKQAEDTMRIKASTEDSEQNMVRCLSLLKSAMEEILVNNSQVDDVDVEELRRSTFTMVLHEYGERLYDTMKEVITKHVESKISSNVRDKVIKSSKNDLLDTTIEAWREQQINMAHISHFLLYLDIHYAQSNGRDNLRTVGIKIFRDQVYVHIRDRVQSALLEMMDKERNGEDIDHSVIKNTCQLLITLGVNSRSVYEDGFERTFLQKLAAVHKLQSQALLSKNDAVVYVKEVEKILNEEEKRPRNYLDVTTEAGVIKVAEEELLSKPMKTVIEMKNSGVIHLVKNQLVEELDLMFKMFGRVPKGRETIEDCISQYVLEQKKIEAEKQKRIIEEQKRAMEEEQRRVLEEQKRAMEEQKKLMEQKKLAIEAQKRAMEEQIRIIEEQKRAIEEKTLINGIESVKIENSRKSAKTQNVKNSKCDETIIEDLKKIGKVDDLNNRRDVTSNKTSNKKKVK